MIPLFVYGASPWDKYLITPPTAALWQSWFQARASMIVGWTPWQDPTIKWFAGPVGVYIDTYAIYKAADGSNPHPDWTNKDAAGNLLFIPWNCGGGTCPQYCGDVSNQEFYSAQAAGATLTRRTGYTAQFWDDVNLDVRSGDGGGNIVLPQYWTAETWAEWMTRFVEKVRHDNPGIVIIHNSIWFSSAPQACIDREIKAADYINCERGFGDGNLNPQTFEQFATFIDRVHALGRSVIQDEYTHDNLAFKIACFLLCYKPGDLMCIADLFPDIWDAQMEVDFGEATGPRYSNTAPDGTVTWHRDFTKVSVVVNFATRAGSVTPHS